MFYGDFERYSYIFEERHDNLDNTDIYDVFVGQNTKYVDYTVEEIRRFSPLCRFSGDYITIEETYLDKKFFGLYKKKKTREHVIGFTKIIYEKINHIFNTTEKYSISYAVDDYNKVIYWKFHEDLGKYEKERQYYEKQKQQQQRQQYERQQQRQQWQRYNGQWNQKTDSNSKLQEYLKFLNIGDKHYDKESLKKHYRKLSKMYHPDLPNGNAEMMQKINIAYDYIMETL